MRDARPQQDDQAGYSLVELLVYISFAVVILTLIGGMLINTLAAERTISGRTGASTSGQIIAQSIHAGVRNATALNLSANGQLLRTANVGNAAVATPYCQVWFYAPGREASVYYRRADLAAGPVTVPTAAQIARDGWLLLGTGVTPRQSNTALWALSGSPADTVTLSLSVATDAGDPPALLEATSTSRQDVSTESPCFA